MKRILSLLFAIIILLSSATFAFASESQPTVEVLVTTLLNDALANPNEFELTDLTDTNVYLCNPINPYVLDGYTLQKNNDVEYYFVITDSEFLSCIKLCYNNGRAVSATMNLSLAEAVNANCSINDTIQIVTHDGSIFIKTNSGVLCCNTDNSNEANTVALIEQAEGNFHHVSIKSRLTEIQTNPVVSRSSVSLAVPYVPQVSNTCWSAAAAAFGQYYNSSSPYSSFSALDWANLLNINPMNGASMDTALIIINDYFEVSTVHYNYALSRNAAINLFNQGRPVLAGFTDEESGMGHMVVLCGYNDYGTSGNVVFYIRDSNYEC